MKETPTKETLKTGETGSSDTTEPTTITSRKLEQEAQAFRAKKRPPVKPKPMTSRIYLAGQAMNALLVRNQGAVRREEIKREAYDWADFMLGND